jgi:DNA polymerase II small subunit/DNA polymerase delta subunit B
LFQLVIYEAITFSLSSKTYGGSVVTMRILLVSDIHYSKKPFHDEDQSEAFDWLCDIVEKEDPICCSRLEILRILNDVLSDGSLDVVLGEGDREQLYSELLYILVWLAV